MRKFVWILALLLLAGCGGREVAVKTEEPSAQEIALQEPAPPAAAMDVYPVVEEIPSPDGAYIAEKFGARTYTTVTVRTADGALAWEFELPEGGPIPEYTFLPEAWCEWLSEDTVRLTVGRGGDAGEQRVFRVIVVSENGTLAGIVLEEKRECLPGDYDFDRDGEADAVEVVTLLEEARPVWYELQINDRWVQEAHTAHMGWTSVFALELDGEDFLLRYNPCMGQGLGSYGYELFSLNERGEEQMHQTASVVFDINFGAPHFGGFDPQAVAAFLEEVHGLLADSVTLLSTESFQLTVNGRGAEFWHDDFTEGMLQENDDWEQALRGYQESCSNP